jgi:hypothetical protein
MQGYGHSDLLMRTERKQRIEYHVETKRRDSIYAEWPLNELLSTTDQTGRSRILR